MVKQSIKFIVAGILASLFVSVATTGRAQNFPVQAFATLTPPYSLKLSDYAAPEGNRMRITLLLKDAQQPTLDVRLRLTIEGNGVKLTTNPSFYPTPITLMSSTLYEVSYDELSDYFLPQNLIAEGISMSALTSSGMLPEGLYRFKVEAVEAHRNVPVSNTAMAIGWLMLNDPPQWISPRQGQKLTAGEPQGIQFLWTRCGMSSPNAALSTQYEVTMVEMVQQGMDPNVAIVTLPPVYQGISPIENLFYGPDKPELIAGHSYAVRIRAFDTRGIDLYRNGGLSPVITFRYGDPCIAPVFLSSDNISEQTADLSWNSTALATGYQVRFRENGTDLSDWYEEPATQTTYTVKNLKPDCTYEYQVQSECGSLPSDYSVSGTLKTKKLENQNQSCSEQLDNANMPTNRDPLSALHTNQTFLAGVMPVKVTSVQGSNGIFTGMGEVYLPIAGVGLSCTFNKVGINTTYQLISGEVITTKSKNTTIYGSGGVTVLDTLHLDNPIDTIIVNPNGDVAVVSGGDTTFIPLANQPVVIYPPTGGGAGTTTGDNTGNGGGDGTGGGGSTGGGGNTSYGDGPLIVENGTVKPYNPAGDLPTAFFHKASMSTYGYDSLAYEALRSYYPVATINGKEVGIPYKALPVSGSDNVVLELKPGSSKLTTDSLTIDVQTNAKVAKKEVMGNNRLMVSLQGLSEGEEPIMVRYTKHNADGKTEQVDIGAAKAVVYQPQPMTLVVVPLAGTTAPDASALQSQLTAIYGQAVTSWTVTVAEPFGYTIPGGQLEFGSSEMASSYTEGMNTLIDAYKVANPSLEDDTYYLFVVPRFSDATLQGYMPRARRFGFIAQSSTGARTLAHELGHGAFNLEHTFPVLPQGTTDNLMDYNGGTRLIKPQWDLIHNPELTTGLLDDETDAASISCSRTYYPAFAFGYKTYEIDNPVQGKYYTFLSPAGIPISLPYNVTNLKFGEDFYSMPISTSGGCSSAGLFIKNLPKAALTSFTIGNVDFKGEIQSVTLYEGDKHLPRAAYVFNGYLGSGSYFIDKSSFGKDELYINIINTEGVLENINCSLGSKTIKENENIGAGELDLGLNLPCILGATTQSTNGINSDVNFYAEKLKELILSGNKFLYTDDSRIDEKTIKDIDDRLFVYADELRNEGKKIYVVNSKISYYLDDKQKADFAKAVVEKCGNLFDANKMTFVCIPYFLSPLEQTSAKAYYFTSAVGYYSENLSSSGQGSIEIVKDLYSQIPKPYIEIPYYLTYKGELVEIKPIRKEQVTGKEHIYEFRFFEDGRCDQYIDLLNKALAEAYIINNTPVLADYSRFTEINAEIVNFNEEFPPVTPNIINHEIFESCLKETNVEGYSVNAQLFAKWYRYNRFSNVNQALDKLNINIENSSDPSDNCYFGGYNAVVYDGVVNKLDAIGLLLSPLHLDIITDIAGTIYTGYYSDWGKTAGYAAGAAIPMVAVVKSGKMLENVNALINGSKKLIKEEETYKIVDNIADAAVDLATEGEKLWTKIDDFDGLFNGKSATYYDVSVTYQAARERVGVAFIENDILEFHLNIPEKLQKQGIGSEVFKKAIQDYAPSKVKGWWKKADIYTGGESVNLTIFKEKIAGGMSPIDAAFETPTGKILKANGFDGVPEIIKNTPDEVIIHFNPSNK
ncbi:MAG TPA: fibronectin type III domain-containing protein [Williamwhitmania sp.]|nr:fibronectin type III domain-containing protein [Williamwhitmania sp.]